MNAAIAVYFASGVVLTMQSVIRGVLRVRDLESFCTAVGVVVIWPIVIISEAVTVIRGDR